MIVKGIIKLVCIIVGLCGLILLFSEAELTAPVSTQIGLWLKGIGMLVGAFVVGALASEDEEVEV